MKRSWMPVLIALAVTTCGGGLVRAQTAGDKPTVLKLDPALDTLVSSDAKLETVATGYGFTEGITWDRKGGYLLLSDIPANVIYKLPPAANRRSSWSTAAIRDMTSGGSVACSRTAPTPRPRRFEQFALLGSNGLTIDKQGRVVICAGGDRELERIEKNGKRTILADKYDGKRFNGPNDVIVKKDGTIYFTDGFDGLRGADKDRKGLDSEASSW